MKNVAIAVMVVAIIIGIAVNIDLTKKVNQAEETAKDYMEFANLSAGMSWAGIQSYVDGMDCDTMANIMKRYCVKALMISRNCSETHADSVVKEIFIMNSLYWPEDIEF